MATVLHNIAVKQIFAYGFFLQCAVLTANCLNFALALLVEACSRSERVNQFQCAYMTCTVVLEAQPWPTTK